MEAISRFQAILARLIKQTQFTKWGMILASIFSLVVLVFLLGAQWLMRPSAFWRTARMVFWVLVVGSVLLPSYLSYQQYQLWLAHPISQLLLPPHQNIFYFLKYVLNNFFLSGLLSVFLAVVCWLLVKFLNRIKKEQVFELSEGYLLGSSIILIGLSNAAWYLAGVLAVAALFSIFYFLFSRDREKRFSLQYFWLPIAVLVILIVKFIKL